MVARWPRLIVTILLALSVGTSAFANCLPSDPQPSTEMPCCPDGQLQCVPAMQPVTCCATNSTSDDRLLTTKPAGSFKLLIPLAGVAAFVPLASAVGQRFSPVLTTLVASSPPLFLLGASLRI